MHGNGSLTGRLRASIIRSNEKIFEGKIAKVFHTKEKTSPAGENFFKKYRFIYTSAKSGGIFLCAKGGDGMNEATAERGF